MQGKLSSHDEDISSLQQEHLQVSDALANVQGEHVALRNDLDLLQTHTAMLSKDGKVLLIGDAQLV